MEVTVRLTKVWKHTKTKIMDKIKRHEKVMVWNVNRHARPAEINTRFLKSAKQLMEMYDLPKVDIRLWERCHS